MAAFYTYRHVELDRVGCGKRKVLKPPGGGSSDIFGTEEIKPSAGYRNKYSTSQFPIGDDMTEEVPRKAPSSIDSNDGASSQTSTSNGSPNNSEPNTPRSGTPLFNNGPIGYDNHQQPAVPTPARQSGRRAQGNPVTGEGYMGIGAVAEKTKEETPRKARIPPGGYSSKLW